MVFARPREAKLTYVLVVQLLKVALPEGEPLLDDLGRDVMPVGEVLADRFQPVQKRLEDLALARFADRSGTA